MVRESGEEYSPCSVAIFLSGGMERNVMGEEQEKRVHVALQSQFQIAGEIFYAVFVMGKDGQNMVAGWKNREGRSFWLNQAA